MIDHAQKKICPEMIRAAKWGAAKWIAAITETRKIAVGSKWKLVSFFW